MESIAELKTICQTTAKKDISNVYMRYVCRSLSIYITRFLIPTQVTADQVSLAMIITGLIANLFFLSSYRFLFFLGTLILQLWYILDCVDGEVARYRAYQKQGEVIKEKMDLPMTGAYWDYLNHYIVHGFLPLSMSFGMYRTHPWLGWFLIGFVASVFQTLLLAVHDTKSRAFIAKIKKASASSYWVRGREKQTEAAEGQEAGGDKKWGPLKWAFVAVHYSCTFPTVMNVATLCALFSVFRIGGHQADYRVFFLLYYAAASMVVFLALAYKNLKNQGLDREFEGLFAFAKHPE